MTYFDGTGDITLYLALFERQIARMNAIKEDWVMYLLSLFSLEIVNIVARELDPVGNNYDYVKKKFLKRFKMSPKTF